MKLFAAVAVLVSILGFFLILAVVFLIYKYKSTSPLSNAHLQRLPPVRKLTIRDGKVVPVMQPGQVHLSRDSFNSRWSALPPPSMPSASNPYLYKGSDTSLHDSQSQSSRWTTARLPRLEVEPRNWLGTSTRTHMLPTTQGPNAYARHLLDQKVLPHERRANYMHDDHELPGIDARFSRMSENSLSSRGSRPSRADIFGFPGGIFSQNLMQFWHKQVPPSTASQDEDTASKYESSSEPARLPVIGSSSMNPAQLNGSRARAGFENVKETSRGNPPLPPFRASSRLFSKYFVEAPTRPAFEMDTRRNPGEGSSKDRGRSRYPRDLCSTTATSESEPSNQCSVSRVSTSTGPRRDRDKSRSTRRETGSVQHTVAVPLPPNSLDSSRSTLFTVSNANNTTTTTLPAAIAATNPGESLVHLPLHPSYAFTAPFAKNYSDTSLDPTIPYLMYQHGTREPSASQPESMSISTSLAIPSIGSSGPAHPSHGHARTISATSAHSSSRYSGAEAEATVGRVRRASVVLLQSGSGTTPETLVAMERGGDGVARDEAASNDKSGGSTPVELRTPTDMVFDHDLFAR